MIRKPLLEMNLFGAAKETDNKLRWDADVFGTKFSLYVPKWRVPDPWPSRIWVSVFTRRVYGDDLPNLSPIHIQGDSKLSYEPIVATVEKYSEHTQTIRYRPTGESKTWEIGEPYIPFALTCGSSLRLRVIVNRDITSQGLFSDSTVIGV